MERVRLQLTNQFDFSTTLQIRITDLNYGGHVGNDTFLSLLHEARQQFLNHHGFSELDFAGVGLIIVDAAIEYKRELSFGDTINISVAALNFDKLGFDLHYLVEHQIEHTSYIAAKAKTGMLCFDYNLKKKVQVPTEAFTRLSLSTQ